MKTPLFEHILVGVAPGGLSSNAAVAGIQLAHRTGANVSLVHAVDVPPVLYPGISESMLASMHAASLSNARTGVLEQLREALGDQGIVDDQLENELTVHPGNPAHVILDRARELGSDLIVLGPHEKRSLLDFGSTARAVLSRSDVPVWTQGKAIGPIRRILVPLDFSNHGRRSIDVATRLAEQLDASLVFMHCYSPPAFAYAAIPEGVPGPTYTIDDERKAAKAQLDDWMSEHHPNVARVGSVFAEGSTVDSILEESENSDLIVMGTHGRTGLSRFFLGSVAYGVLKRAELPVLVVPSAETEWLLDGEHAEEAAKASVSG